ncbi:conserved hypothetical protein [Methylobacterium sp. 4-46]|uniref:tryptophan dimethylallyltransferase family protein n=1 Tax=unclassified Methylobacterium TaxID=2615210 RepID=UPI000165C6C4|nr:MULTISPECIES: tryptophan dimethylallyltransferase family protein [Methylobacterium]ACA14682.1 conserved hypothetical protein [Methylobacterium sp. 4-46]WFT80435.1 tryptophan dimethylallyltransferase family protein [Methylobacterium nodulans]
MGAATRFEAAARTLRAVAAAAGFPPAAREEAVACARLLAASWADEPLAAPPPWSGLGADASGFDASLVLDGTRREVRVTVEAQGRPATPARYLAAARALSEHLAERHGADLSRLASLLPLFARPDPRAAGVLWHGAVLAPGRAPWFKVYLHLMAPGRARARATAEAALDRLGLAPAWPGLAARLAPEDEPLFLSLDLVPGPEARVKLYVRHGWAGPETLAAPHDPAFSGEVLAFVRGLAGDGPIRRGALTAFHLRPGRAEPSHVTTHLRLYPHCARSDAVLAARLTRALDRLGLPAAPYRAALAALAPGGLDGEEGLHGWASLQRHGARPAVSVYVSPRLYLARFGPVALDPERLWPSPVPAAALREDACASP